MIMRQSMVGLINGEVVIKHPLEVMNKNWMNVLCPVIFNGYLDYLNPLWILT